MPKLSKETADKPTYRQVGWPKGVIKALKYLALEQDISVEALIREAVYEKYPQVRP